jgi:signal transduction histidine kinase
MSVISYRQPEREAERLAVPPIAPARRVAPTRDQVVDATLAAVILTMLVLMARMPGQETIPYHILFLSLTMVYGFRVWALLPTVLVTLLVTGTTGWILASHAFGGIIDLAELAEVPLMPALFVAMVWHARRRVAALRQVELMADQRRASLERERGFFRDTSHAIRTPITIARGHLEVAGAGRIAAGTRQHLAIALRQLDRMSSLSNRLLALARLDAGERMEAKPTDLSALIGEIGRNWTAANTDRRWVVGCRPTGLLSCDPEWLELALDALIENAVHYTASGDLIGLSGRQDADRYTITVDDSGPGIAAADLPFVFDRFWHSRPENGPMGSGLGLPMARAVAEAHGGTLLATHSPEGGARFELTIATGS